MNSCRRASVRLLSATLLLLPAAGPAAAQRPDGWRWQLDGAAGADTAWSFERMPPGWHITTGPAVLAWPEATTLDGRYAAEAVMILFPSSGNEGYGLFVAGRELGEPGAHYVAFLVRRDGAAGIFRVRGERREPIRDWTPSGAVQPLAGDQTVSNTVRVEVEAGETVFRVNGAEVARVPEAVTAGGGHVGFRIMPGVNLHITTLDILRRLAPARGS